ncbi:hypothetical protein D3C76_181960 [compost metagenome]
MELNQEMREPSTQAIRSSSKQLATDSPPPKRTAATVLHLLVSSSSTSRKRDISCPYSRVFRTTKLNSCVRWISRGNKNTALVPICTVGVRQAVRQEYTIQPLPGCQCSRGHYPVVGAQDPKRQMGADSGCSTLASKPPDPGGPERMGAMDVQDVQPT